VRAKPDAESTTYASRKVATVKLSVNTDNEGSFEFEGLENADGESLSGKATWTCEEGSEGK
jgi:hypothetical protein